MKEIKWIHSISPNATSRFQATLQHPWWFVQRLCKEGHRSESKATKQLLMKMRWNCSLLVYSRSQSTHQGLLNPVFFLNGKLFALRSGVEHWCLKLAQISQNVSPVGKLRYMYTENCPKNCAGGFNQVSIPNKVVHQYQDVWMWLCSYFRRISTEAPSKCIWSGHFFTFDQLQKKPVNDSPWYISVEVHGQKSFKQAGRKLCAREEAGVDGHKTNHSLRVYAAKELLNTGILEKVVQV